jgi:hypothetical protein
MRSRRASHGGARPLNCGVRRQPVGNDLFLPKQLRGAVETLRAEPKNLEAAANVWRLCGSGNGDDLRSSGWVSLAFKDCALSSTEGVVAMARAYQELFEATGVTPLPADFDAQLLTAFRAARLETSSSAVQWVLDTLKVAK